MFINVILNDIVYFPQGYHEGSTRWREDITEEAEESDEVEAGYISSDESTHAPDLGGRLRVKCRDIWALGISYNHIIHFYFTLNKAELSYRLLFFDFTEDIQYSLRHLPNADEISGLLETGHYEDTVSFVSQTDEDRLRTAVLWACWLGKNSLISKLLKIGADPNSSDEDGR